MAGSIGFVRDLDGNRVGASTRRHFLLAMRREGGLVRRVCALRTGGRWKVLIDLGADHLMLLAGRN